MIKKSAYYKWLIFIYILWGSFILICGIQGFLESIQGSVQTKQYYLILLTIFIPLLIGTLALFKMYYNAVLVIVGVPIYYAMKYNSTSILIISTSLGLIALLLHNKAANDATKIFETWLKRAHQKRDFF